MKRITVLLLAPKALTWQRWKFRLSEATRIMLHVHNNGIGVCGSYSYEVAETKVETVHGLAEQYEFPLLATMEEN